MDSLKFPPLPLDIVDALRLRFPAKAHTVETSIREADWEGGRAEVIDFLAQHLELQSKTRHVL